MVHYKYPWILKSGGGQAISSKSKQDKEMDREINVLIVALALIIVGLNSIWDRDFLYGPILLIIGVSIIYVNFIYGQNFGETLIVPQETVNEIDWMDGYKFEKYVQDLYRAHGYYVAHTQLSGDQGADLILSTKDGERIAVQTKRHSNRVSNKAVQEVVASKALYNCNRCMVVTNNYYTQSAIELANANNVELVDRDGLMRLIHDMPENPSEIIAK